MNTYSSTGFLPWLTLGAAIGASIALPSAYQPGLETRRIVREKAFEVREMAVRAASKIRESVASGAKAES